MKERIPGKWFVSKSLRITLGVAIVLAVYMLANTLYLLLNRFADKLNLEFFAAGKTSIPAIFQVMILSHTGVGILLVLLMLFFGIAHLPKVWRMYKYKSGITGIAYMVFGLVLGITGLFILTSAASHANNWAWWLHVITAVLVPTGYILHRLTSYRNKPQRYEFKRFGFAALVLLFVIVVLHSFTHKEIVLTEEAQVAAEKGLNEGPGAKNRDISDYSDEDFVPIGFIPGESPFYPSAATTTSGGYLPSRIITRDELGAEAQIKKEIVEFGFVKNTAIGAETCARCHQDIVEQWESSAHRFASFNNPFYEATITDMRNNANEPNQWIDQHITRYPDFGENGIGRAKSKWCSGCHDPALMLAGKMNQPVDRNLAEAQAGLTCLACHAIDKIHNLVGNGNYNIADEQEDPYLFPTSKEGTLGAFIHDAVIKAKPDVHKQQMMQPFFKNSEYCLTCHKVSVPQPVNNYRWLRGQDEYDNWHDSGVAKNASRTFYLPAAKQDCQSCHMPLEPAVRGDLAAKNGMVKSHRFYAANTALPFLRNDTATIKKIENFMQSEKLHVDIFAVYTESHPEPIMAVKRGQLSVKAGEKITADVVVRNIGVGHTFPGGTNDSNEGWLEFTVTNEKGVVLAISGYIDENGHLDSMAHAFKAIMLDKNSNPIHKRNVQDVHVEVYTNVIGPGTSDIAHYSFTIPKELEGEKLIMTVRLLWRKFDQNYFEFAYNANPVGFKQFQKIPKLPVTEIAKDKINFTVSSNSAQLVINQENQNQDFSQWGKFNDYGIGLLLENDTRGAARAFRMVEELEPELLDGPLNLAKTALLEGNLGEAYRNLKKCEELKSGDPQVAWVWGNVRQEDGLYDDAIAAYEYVLNYFPDDRMTWRHLGRTYYLDQQYQKSIEAYRSALKIDPEDREAYYHLSLNYRALGNEAEAGRMEKAFQYYKIDESAVATAQKYRKNNPGDNLMAQSIRIHHLEMIIK